MTTCAQCAECGAAVRSGGRLGLCVRCLRAVLAGDRLPDDLTPDTARAACGTSRTRPAGAECGVSGGFHETAADAAACECHAPIDIGAIRALAERCLKEGRS